MSQITTHVLDTTIGKPGKGITISLQERDDNEGWKTLASGITNDDGRIADLLPEGKTLEPGHYRMHFDTGSYFKALDTASFYPEVTIVFEVFDKSHYHVPLLLNPFGYSTYRGS